MAQIVSLLSATIFHGRKGRALTFARIAPLDAFGNDVLLRQ